MPHPVEEPRDEPIYLIDELCERLKMKRRTFYALRKLGRMPFLQEVRPRVGRLVRYRADLVDQYLAGKWYGGLRPRGRKKPAEKKTA